MKGKWKIVLVVSAGLVGAAMTSALDNPRMKRVDGQRMTAPYRVLTLELPREMLDAEWASGGVCDSLLDCAVTSENFCASYGGVNISMFNRNDLTDTTCIAWCNDTLNDSPIVGHLNCTPEEGDGELAEHDPPTGDQCDPDFIGPPDPNVSCPCTGEECT